MKDLAILLIILVKPVKVVAVGVILRRRLTQSLCQRRLIVDADVEEHRRYCEP